MSELLLSLIGLACIVLIAWVFRDKGDDSEAMNRPRGGGGPGEEE